MLIEDRKNYIFQLLEKQSSVTVKDLSEIFNISDVSVRKLLAKMEEEGMLKRAWGGAVRVGNAAQEPVYAEKVARFHNEKCMIAREAYECVKEGDTIFLDSGTTTFELAKLIINGTKRNLIVCTNAINIAVELSKDPEIQVIMIGGELRSTIYSCVGLLAVNMLKMVVVDKAFVTGTHFSIERGFSAPGYLESEVKRAILASSKRKYVMMDSSKFADDSMAIIAQPNEVHVVITDWHFPTEAVEGFAKQGVRVIIAQNDENLSDSEELEQSQREDRLNEKEDEQE